MFQVKLNSTETIDGYVERVFECSTQTNGILEYDYFRNIFKVSASTTTRKNFFSLIFYLTMNALNDSQLVVGNTH